MPQTHAAVRAGRQLDRQLHGCAIPEGGHQKPVTTHETGAMTTMDP
ncbi:hypothetical protein [Yokenella regensburgei]|nr:hypothetical protein [Yokenella regensburgei]